MTYPVLLYAEDFALDADLLRHNLISAGLVNPVRITETVDDTLGYLLNEATELPAVVFLDLNLKGADGVQVIRSMRAHDRTQNIPVIVLTIFDDQIEQIRLLELGKVQCISKPKFNARTLMDALIALRIHWAIVYS